MNLPLAFERYRSELSEELRSIIGEDSSPFYQMMRYHLGWLDRDGYPQEGMGGKMLRPTLCLLTCEAVGGGYHLAIPAACAVELVHNFTLIHDDIEDDSLERRHRPTLWSIWGKPQAINAGDGMYAVAHLAMLRTKGVSQEKVTRANLLLDEACLRLCEGQYLDIHYEGRLDISIEDYLEMVRRKTAALFECSTHIGAILGTEDESLVERFRCFGERIGLAYQIRDDVLGIWGEKRAKDTDIRKRKKTLPVVYALERARGAEREKLLEIYRQEVINEGDAKEVIRILSQLGAEGYAQEMAGNYYQEALSELEMANLPPKACEELMEVTDFLVKREH